LKISQELYIMETSYVASSSINFCRHAGMLCPNSYMLPILVSFFLHRTVFIFHTPSLQGSCVYRNIFITKHGVEASTIYIALTFCCKRAGYTTYRCTLSIFKFCSQTMPLCNIEMKIYMVLLFNYPLCIFPSLFTSKIL
jgi:hypothetical protein